MYYKKYKIDVIKIVFICLLGLFVYQPIQAQEVIATPCTNCHLCSNPTTDNPCVMGCLRQSNKATAINVIEDIPGIIQLDRIKNLYEPVIFDHQNHAKMGNMGKGCLECHHYSSPKDISPCWECHSDPKTLAQPGLKGAYHRQCMGCHQNWSHSTACENCHKPINKDQNIQRNNTLQMTVSIHSNIIKPSVKIYETSVRQGRIVTFYHNEHIDLFGLDCGSCHQKESCLNCHDNNLHTTITKSEEEIHGICNECHRKDDCNKCHDKSEKQPFKHDTSKWGLGIYHDKLACEDCHITGQRIKDFSGDCENCHKFSDSNNFSHSVTGLELDEIHSEFSCEDCHINQQYHYSKDCGGCHDDNRSIENATPGKRIQISAILNSSVKREEVH